MPAIWVFAGPNGSGKSTVTRRLMDGAPGVYINADMIQAHLHCDALQAAQIAEETREYYLRQGEDFTFETVLSTERNLELLRRAREQGYEICCFYVLTRDPAVNLARVRQRAAAGGHDVPEDKVVERYHRCLRLLPKLLPLCSRVLIFDNTGDRKAGTAAVIADLEDGQPAELCPNAIWPEADILALLEGRYAPQLGET